MQIEAARTTTAAHQPISMFRIFRLAPLYLAALVGSFITILPFVWMILSSIKNNAEIFRYPPTFLPENLILDNFTKLFAMWPFGSWYINSVLVATLGTTAVLFFSSLAGFGFAKYNFKGRTLMFGILIGSTMIPFQLILIPLFVQVSRLGMINSYAGLIIPGMAPALGIFLMKQFMSSIPNELLDSARIDGCSEFGIYWNIIVPLIRPAMGTLAIITFLGSWNSFLWPLVILRSDAMMTLPIGLARLTENVPGKTRDFGVIMAAATLVSVPVIAVFMAMQRQFISGLLSGSVKQ
jgi:ABC-type glycerol-3-phosphate transport system permease component